MLDTDEGARYLGEFALGVNPRIDRPMKDTLYDEKIGGSLHLTPGRAYEEADNGNRSSVHWDLVLIQTPEWGGGEIYFDDVLVRKDGLLRAARAGGAQPREPGGRGLQLGAARPRRLRPASPARTGSTLGDAPAQAHEEPGEHAGARSHGPDRPARQVEGEEVTGRAAPRRPNRR